MKNKKPDFLFISLMWAAVMCVGLNAGFCATDPKLVVIIVGDQIRADYLEKYRSYLSPDGLRRFLEHGAYFKNAFHDDAVTKTSPGHVLIGSGLYPKDSGIIGNEWFDAASGKTVSPSETIPGGDRVQLKWFVGRSFAERLHQKKPHSRIVSVSLKDRAALLLTGPDQDDAYWWDRKDEEFVGYKPTPAWLKQFNGTIETFVAQNFLWDPAFTPSRELAHAMEKQALLTQGHIRDNAHLGLAFPHPIKSVEALMLTPLSDNVVEQVAEKAVREWTLGHNSANEPDVLTVSFSAVDIVGHEFGPDSQEVMDAFLNLDQSVAKLMRFIDRSVGTDVVWVFSSDHGMTSFPEVSKGNGLEAGRVHLDSTTFASSGLVRAVSLPYVYVEKAAAIATVKDALLRIVGVQNVYSEQDIRQGRAPAAVAKSFYVPKKGDKRSGDLFVVLKPHYIFSEEDNCGSTHGQPTDDDQRVPLGFYGPQISAKTYDAPTSVAIVAPTLLKQLGISTTDLAAPADIFSVAAEQR